MTQVWIQNEQTGAREYDAHPMGWVTRDDGLHAIVAVNDGEHPWFVHVNQVTLKLSE